MRPLTDLERRELTEIVSLALAWDSIGTSQRDDCRRKAKIVVAHIERIGVHGATAKRAVDALVKDVLREGAA